MQLASLLAQEQEWAKWEEQQRQSQCSHANQLTKLKCYEDELAWQRMKSEHEQERQHNGELVQMQESWHAQEEERLQVEQQIQAECGAVELYKVGYRWLANRQPSG